MENEYLVLVKSGIVAVSVGYGFRYLFPVLVLLGWQISFGQFARTLGMRLPEDTKEVFYVPNSGQPLVFHWFHPNHKAAIVSLLLAGTGLAYLFQKMGDTGFQIIASLVPIFAIIFILSKAVKSFIAKSNVRTSSEEVFFSIANVIEIVLVFSVVKQLLNS